MRPLSVAERKGIRGAAARQQQPTEGSLIRQMYDRLMEKKGEAVSVDGIYKDNVGKMIAIGQLRDFYGLDIRLVSQGFHATGKLDSLGRRRKVQRDSLFVLAGEWDGKVYIDYIAERLKNE